jgi:hypothetical protein
MPARIKYIFTLLCALALYTGVRAQQPFSYVYIQGDKQTPFYVKINGQMMPRYGKNYNIISELSPGTIEIEILFQQKIYPSQKFTIDVPENGSRAFLLNKQDKSFALYDLKQKKYVDR